jgi:hypothetical protein
MLIDEFLPTSGIHELDRIAVVAEPGQAYSTVRSFDLLRIPFVRRAASLKALPERLASLARGGAPTVRACRLDDLVRHGTGLVLLGEDDRREIVAGAIAKLWPSRVEFAAVSPRGFTRFREPGYVKLAFALRCDPRQHGGTWITLDARIGATDRATLDDVRRRWIVLRRVSERIRRGFRELVDRDLGAVKLDDDSLPLPGDEILPRARFQRTHAAVLESPPYRVFPWLVQMGGGRAGWYAADLIDNGGVRSATRIVPELQDLHVGDMVPLRPKAARALAVLRLEPGRALVLGSPGLLGPHEGAPDATRPEERSWTWAFVLEPIGDSATALTVRVREDYRPSFRAIVRHLALGAAYSVRERDQLRNLRRRVALHG